VDVANSRPKSPTPGTWPAWARRIVSFLVLFHGLAIFAVGLAVAPSSSLERGVADFVLPYLELTDQAHAHRYYSSEPPPTPVVQAHLQFDDGRPERMVRLPDRSLRPRLRYQRSLALANFLGMDAERLHNDEGYRNAVRDGHVRSVAESYAAHLCRTTPHCSSVTLTLQYHLIPGLDRYRAAQRPGSPPLDEEDEEFYTVPERIGEFPCKGL
jgi:hypothetical protein